MTSGGQGGWVNFYGVEIDRALYAHLLEYMPDSEIDAMFRAIVKPPSRYYVRVNTVKISPGELAKRLSARGLEVYRDEHFEDALWMPVRGPFRIPSARKAVVVDKRAAESVMLGADLYAPGVVKTDCVRQGEEVNVVSESGVVVAHGIAAMDSEEAVKLRRGLYIRVLHSLYKTPRIRDLPEYQAGMIYSQSLPAIAVGHAVRMAGVPPGSLIVDFNAAPGGKATHLAQMGYRVVAFDRSAPKMAELKREVERLGLVEMVDILLHDSRYVDRDFPRLTAGAALVDPPCTDIGVRPKIYHRVTLDAAKTLARYQLQFLRVAIKIAPVVAYSTCTLTFIENEGVIKRVRAEPLDAGLGVGAPGWGCNECRRFLPHVHDTPGFFIALLRRR